MRTPLLKYICIVLSLILFAGYLPAQIIEKSHVDSISDAQTGAISVDEKKQSDNTARMEAKNDSAVTSDTISQKISDKEALRKEKKKALIGLIVIVGIIAGIFIAAWFTSLGGINEPS